MAQKRNQRTRNTRTRQRTRHYPGTYSRTTRTVRTTHTPGLRRAEAVKGGTGCLVVTGKAVGVALFVLALRGFGRRFAR